jgi:NADH-quinone oxidoreductase subunit N
MDYKTLLNLYLPEIFLTICALFTLFYSFSRKKRTFPIFLLLSYGFLIYFDYKNLSLYFEELLPFIILIDGFTFIILYLFYLREKGENFVITNFLIFLHLLAIHILLKTESLSIFFLSIELLSFVFYILIGIESKKIRDFGPLLRYFMLGSFSSVILLFSIILIYSQTGTFSFEGFSFSFENPSIFKLALFLFFFALGFKILFIPFQFFLPDVFSRLSFPYIALISLTPKAGIIVFLYKLKLFLPEIIFPITVFAILTLLITNFVGIFDEDVKRVIAYSSISHSSFLFIILLLHEPFLSKILLFYLISYFVMKGGLFYSLHPFYLYFS